MEQTGSAVRGDLWVVSAPSGGGKTSLCRALVPRLAARGITVRISVSCTTRAPRAGEREGVDYCFLDEAHFAAQVAAGGFVEHAGVFGRHYGTPRAPLEAAVAAGEVLLLDIDWQGGRQIRTRYPDACGVFILPPSRAELERRLRGREGSTEELVNKRMAAARTEMAHYAEYPYVIVNADFDTALAEFEALIVAQRLGLAAQRTRHAALLAQLLDDGD
ncbi:MAG: guanylate kinase [Nevskiaceae bacterium]|nr:MAG: guanylate kinase [Nevskiaceae bacterium]TBR72021.1 MAG: guanylate kinase [Nevskiaceae bacterium]